MEIFRNVLILLYAVVVTTASSAAAQSAKCQHRGSGLLQLDFATKLDFEIGKDVEVPCRIVNNTFVSRDRDWTVQVDHKNLRFKRFKINEQLSVESDLVEKQDDNTAVFVLKNATEDSFQLTCMGKITDTSGKEVILPGCIATIAIGHVPQKVHDFKCISMNFKNLSCTWENPLNKVKTNYTIELARSLTDFYTTYNECPANMSTPTSCLWTQHTTPNYDNKVAKLKFRIKGANTLGNNSWEYEFHHASIVKLSPVRKLFHEMDSPTSANVTWILPDETRHGGWKENLVIVSSVEVRRGQHEEPEVIETSETGIRLNSLIPNTKYNITVRCRTEGTNRFDLYSDPQSIEFKLPKAKPDGPPNFPGSAFQYRLFNDVRTITLLFEEIPKEHWNDDELSYVLQVCSQNGQLCYNRTERQSNVELEDLSLTKRYYINVWSANSLGISDHSSSITIGGQGELLPSAFDIAVVLSRQSVTITWKIPVTLQNGELDNTVYWCESITQQTCNGPVHTKNVGSVSEATIHIDDPRDYLFGVALSKVNGRTSGVTWSSCEIGQVRELEALPDTDTSLNIRWRNGCGLNGKDIEGYQIEYCRVDTEPEKALEVMEICQHPRIQNASKSCHTRNFTIEGDENTHVLDGLEKGEVYRIVLRVVNRTTHRFAPDSIAVCAMSKSTRLAVHLIVGIGVGSALGLTILVFSLYILAKWMQKKLEVAKRVKVKLPRNIKNGVQYNDFKRRAEFNQIGQNGLSHIDDPSATMLNDLNAKSSHSSLDKLIIETTPTVNGGPSDKIEDSRGSPNLNGEPGASPVKPMASDLEPQPPATTTSMPPYTQLGVSAAHFSTVAEQPGNTGYSQLSVIQTSQNDHSPTQGDHLNEPQSRPAEQPRAAPARTGGYVTLDRAMTAPPASNGYVPVVRANQ